MEPTEDEEMRAGEEVSVPQRVNLALDCAGTVTPTGCFPCRTSAPDRETDRRSHWLGS